MTDLRFACQTYSWQMSMDRFRGRVEHMVNIAAHAGFTGFEPETVMLGDQWSPKELDTALDGHGLQLAALCLVNPWRGAVETEQEKAEADKVIAAVAAHPGALITLVQYPGSDRSDLRDRQENAMRCVADVARRAADAGVHCTFHANSPDGSVFRDAEDYRWLMDHLPESIGLTPDLGHLAKGGLDVVATVKDYRSRIDHLHVKDLAADGRWAPIGEGTVDIRGVLEVLVGTGYDGWVVLEDESPQAEEDPDAAIARNGEWIRAFTTEPVA